MERIDNCGEYSPSLQHVPNGIVKRQHYGQIKATRQRHFSLQWKKSEKIAVDGKHACTAPNTVPMHKFKDYDISLWGRCFILFVFKILILIFTFKFQKLQSSNFKLQKI